MRFLLFVVLSTLIVTINAKCWHEDFIPQHGTFVILQRHLERIATEFDIIDAFEYQSPYQPDENSTNYEYYSIIQFSNNDWLHHYLDNRFYKSLRDDYYMSPNYDKPSIPVLIDIKD